MNLLNLRSPFMISSRLLPGLRINRACFQIDETQAKWILDIPRLDGKGFDEHTGSVPEGNIRNLQHMFEALLDFLQSAAESLDYERGFGGDGEFTDTFPAPVVEWALENMDELSILRNVLEETPGLITQN